VVLHHRNKYGFDLIYIVSRSSGSVMAGARLCRKLLVSNLLLPDFEKLVLRGSSDGRVSLGVPLMDASRQRADHDNGP
jgi:hypothetical protein